MFKRLLPLALAAVVATTAGCGFQVGDVGTPLTNAPTMKPGPNTGAPNAGDPPPAPVQTAPPAPGAHFSDADVTKEIGDAVQVIDTYWSTHWSEFFTGSYTPPRVVGAYQADDPHRPSCGGQLAEAFNAYYCIPEDYIAWDFQLMREGYAQGDAWIYLVIAHEWAHAVQNRLQVNLVAEANELQADCLAGAVLWGAKNDGVLEWEEGDTTEIGTALSAFGDDYAWTDPTAHGDAIQRVTAFGQGRTEGVRGCLAQD
ncbi:neutral zinc metallopeptidase [Actinocorallia populi]|uniref:neutral zinc metallopeptidase n=1 Tax=Actinocorallia populi TaxID=2079200 RepID=UPI000D088781|nr:neutral zinc metallopeptidase [Actinocorallia populi]